MKTPKATAGILAGLTIIVWSSTFISTKVLLSVFSPVEILVYRFAFAYLLMFILYPRVHRPESLKTELKLLAAGVTGGSLYFVAENYALKFSLASNVSLLVSTAPILTAIAAHLFLKNEKITRNAVVGAIVAFAGAALIILNGEFVLKLNPAGDFLAILSALCWAAYSIIVRDLDTKYSTYYITRKIFFWTLVTIIPLMFVSPVRLDLTPFLDWKIAGNMLFLALFASCAAYAAWSKVIWAFGATRANNFIYFIPLLTLIESAVFLGEKLTPFALVGAALIFAGVWVTGRKTGNKERTIET
jgi:drug/metabolite transporter (DMT)-like permease